MNWDALGVILGPSGAVAVLFELIRRDRATRLRDEDARTTAETAVDHAGVAAERAAEAADLARPTGNGYAGQSLGLLQLIHGDLQEMRTEAAADRLVLTTHLGDHARAGLSVPAQGSPAEPPTT